MVTNAIRRAKTSMMGGEKFAGIRVNGSVWVKIGTDHSTTVVKLLNDGKISEEPLFNPQRQSWTGTWKLENEVLILQIGKYIVKLDGALDTHGLLVGKGTLSEKPMEGYGQYKLIPIS